MTGIELGQYANTILGGILILRLSMLGLFGTYRAFSCFLMFDLAQSFFAIIFFTGFKVEWDYRIVWTVSRAISWVLILWTVYSLLASVLKSLPGILNFSHRLLNSVFVISLVVCVCTIIPELQMAQPGAASSVMGQTVLVTLAAERTVTMASFLSLLAIFLFFVVWFPVEIPRNLAIFSIGLVVYLGVKTSSLLIHTTFPSMSQQTVNLISLLNTSVLAICFICWSFFISSAGQMAKLRVGHIWEAQEQERLILQLEAMNSTLLKTRK